MFAGAIQAMDPVANLCARRSRLVLPQLSVSATQPVHKEIVFEYVNPVMITYDMAASMIRTVVHNQWSCDEWDFADDAQGRLNRCNRYLFWINYLIQQNIDIPNFPADVLFDIVQQEKRKLLSDLFVTMRYERSDFAAAVEDIDGHHQIDGVVQRCDMQ